MPWKPSILTWTFRMHEMVNKASDLHDEYDVYFSNLDGEDDEDGFQIMIKRIGENFMMIFTCTTGQLVVMKVMQSNADQIGDCWLYTYTAYGLVEKLFERWRSWARKRVRERAANRIRDFYFDYVVPKVYNPHMEGRSFLNLKNKLDSNLL